MGTWRIHLRLSFSLMPGTPMYTSSEYFRKMLIHGKGELQPLPAVLGSLPSESLSLLQLDACDEIIRLFLDSQQDALQ
jgi:hypothetical protein